jgi:DNA polymerase-3 subunit gamma/tau
LGLTGANQLLVSNCAYLGRVDDVIRLGLDSRSESLLTKSRQQALAAALSEKFGEKLRVDIQVGEPAAETPVQEKERLEGENLEAARRSLENDPNVRALKDMFGAELTPGSIELVQDQPAGSQE